MTPSDVDVALSGEAGDRGLRALIHGPGRTALVGTLRSMIGPERELRSCRLRRTHYKPGRKLATYYDVSIRGVPRPIPIAATWFAGDAHVDPVQLSHAEDDLKRSLVPTSFERLWSLDESGAMLVLAAPLDPAFPHLRSFVDSARVADVLSLSAARATGENTRPAVRFLRYRPGQRQVLEYRGGLPEDIVLKLYKPGALRAVADRVVAFAQLTGANGSSPVSAVSPAAVIDDSDAIVYHRLPAQPLSRLLRDGFGGDHLHRVGRWLRTIHEIRPAPDSDFEERDVAALVNAVNRACAGMSHLRPDYAAYASVIVDCAIQRLATLEQEAPALTHGDIKADHVLCGSDRLTVIDLDRCAVADPAADLGKLLADLRWWDWLNGRSDSDSQAAALLSGYGPARARVARARLYAAILLVKMAGRRTSLARYDWAARTGALLTLAARAAGAGRGI